MLWGFYRGESSFAFSQSVIQGFALMAQAQSYFLRWHFGIVWYPKQGLEQSMKVVFFQLSMKISPLSACSCPFSEAIELLTDTLPHTRLTKEQMLETLGISLPLLNVWTAYIWAEWKITSRDKYAVAECQHSQAHPVFLVQEFTYQRMH